MGTSKKKKKKKLLMLFRTPETKIMKKIKEVPTINTQMQT